MYSLDCVPQFETISDKKRRELLKQIQSKSVLNDDNNNDIKSDNSNNNDSDGHNKSKSDSIKSSEIPTKKGLYLSVVNDSIDLESMSKRLSNINMSTVYKKRHSLEGNKRSPTTKDTTAAFSRSIALRNSFFKLTVLAVVICIFSYLLIMSLFIWVDIKCESLFYCILLTSKNGDSTNLEELSWCANEEMPPSTMLQTLFLFLSVYSFVIPLLYALLWQVFWRSRNNPLLEYHRQDIKRWIGLWLALPKKEKKRIVFRNIGVWFCLLFSLIVVLAIEYGFHTLPEFQTVPVGRYLYCLVVLILGMILISIVGKITRYEYTHFIKTSNHIYDSDWESNERNDQFHRQILLVIINTTVALYIPAFDVYPTLGDGITTDAIKSYLMTIEISARESTFFWWSAILSSEIIIFCFEFFNGVVFMKCLIDNPKITCCQKSCFNIGACLASCLKTKFIFVQHSWFLAMILFYYANCFAWLNPSIYLICAISIAILLILYKIRFKFISPKIDNHYVADAIYKETIMYILFCAWPVQFILLLPLHHSCDMISFGGLISTLFLTIVFTLIYIIFYRFRKWVKHARRQSANNNNNNNNNHNRKSVDNQ